MPAQPSFSVNDGETVPISHNFTPQGVSNVAGEALARWKNLGQSRPLGMEETMVASRRSKADGSVVQKFSTKIPVTGLDVNGKTVVLRTIDAYTVVNSPVGSTEQDRKNARLLHSVFQTFSTLSPAIDRAEGFW